ncbi:PWWP domain [Macleaya cordata]|uniref:PWWP domain n=1 Tax=Macleaya cordata TaxID=56857 RepID=A0A200QTN0_MACCD|nr:PWWP domain [Macleaya cordata]
MDDKASDEDDNDSLPWSLRTRKKKKNERNRGFEESSRVLETKKRFKGFDETLNEMSVQDSHDEASDDDDNDFLLRPLRTRNKKKRKGGFEDSSRVLETKKCFKGFDETLHEMSVQGSDDEDNDDDDGSSRVLVLEDDIQPGLSDEDEDVDDDDECDTESSAEIERFRIGDIVWAKALPYTWWPGWIHERDRCRVSISFFGHERSQIFKVSEIRSFQKHLSSMPKLVPLSFLDSVDCALAELGRRMVLGLMCPCQGSSMEELNVDQQHLVKKSIPVKKMNFQPRGVLGFVKRMAVCPWVDDAETISAVRSGAQVSAFRRYVFIETDWIYKETMRLSESGTTSDDDSEEANMKSTGIHRNGIKGFQFLENRGFYILLFNQLMHVRWSGRKGVTQEAEFSEEEQEGKPEVSTRQVEKDSGICKKDRVEPLHEFLTHLRCLALDPFYAGPEGSSSMCQKILNYRKLVYCKILNKVPVKRSSEEEQEIEPDVLTLQVEHDSGIRKKDRVEPLYDFLTHLRCLALDPFYAGPEDSSSMCQKILNYRKLVYCKVLDEVPLKHTSDHGNEVEISKVPEKSRLDSVSHLNHATSRTLTERNVGTRSTDGTHVSPLLSNVPIQHYDMAGIREKSKDVMVDCTSTSVGELSAVDPMVKDSIALVKDSPDHDNEALTDKVQEVTRVETVAHLTNTATRTEHGYSFAVANDDTHGCHLFSHGQEDTNKNGFDDITMDVKDDCSLGFRMEISPNEPVFKDAIKTHSDDNVGVANGETSEFLSNLGDNHNHIMIHSRNKIGAADSITDKEVILEVISDENSEEKRRPNQPAFSGFPSDFQEVQPSYPLSPVSIGNNRFQSSTTNSSLDHPKSLHMKFPKDFKLPSKEELVKKFCPFGPLDSSRTKVFFYTGSAQVVFLCELDAEAAYHFAKRKKIFFGQTNVRFWLDQHEKSRRKTNKIPSPLSFSTVGSSALNLKSCLRTSSNAQGKNDEVKRNRVKFLPGSQIFSLPASMPKSGASIPSDSCKFSTEVGPDISVQMLVLLEKCNQLVCKTKDNLGVQSNYSLFTYNNSDIPNLDDE